MSTEADDLVKLARDCGATDERITDQQGVLIRTEVLFERLDQLATFSSRIAAQKAAEVDAPSEETPPTPFVQTFPDHIWLDAGEAMEFAEPGDTFRDLEEVTWSEDNATGFGVKYIRADLAAASPAEPGGKV